MRSGEYGTPGWRDWWAPASHTCWSRPHRRGCGRQISELKQLRQPEATSDKHGRQICLQNASRPYKTRRQGLVLQKPGPVHAPGEKPRRAAERRQRSSCDLLSKYTPSGAWLWGSVAGRGNIGRKMPFQCQRRQPKTSNCPFRVHLEPRKYLKRPSTCVAGSHRRICPSPRAVCTVTSSANSPSARVTGYMRYRLVTRCPSHASTNISLF